MQKIILKVFKIDNRYRQKSKSSIFNTDYYIVTHHSNFSIIGTWNGFENEKKKISQVSLILRKHFFPEVSFWIWEITRSVSSKMGNRHIYWRILLPFVLIRVYVEWFKMLSYEIRLESYSSLLIADPPFGLLLSEINWIFTYFVENDRPSFYIMYWLGRRKVQKVDWLD